MASFISRSKRDKIMSIYRDIILILSLSFHTLIIDRTVNMSSEIAFYHD